MAGGGDALLDRLDLGPHEVGQLHQENPVGVQDVELVQRGAGGEGMWYESKRQAQVAARRPRQMISQACGNSLIDAPPGQGPRKAILMFIGIASMASLRRSLTSASRSRRWRAPRSTSTPAAASAVQRPGTCPAWTWRCPSCSRAGGPTGPRSRAAPGSRVTRRPLARTAATARLHAVRVADDVLGRQHDLREAGLAHGLELGLQRPCKRDGVHPEVVNVSAVVAHGVCRPFSVRCGPARSSRCPSRFA